MMSARDDYGNAISGEHLIDIKYGDDPRRNFSSAIKKEDENMEHLYSINVVSKSREILFSKKVVARDTDEAKFLISTELAPILTSKNLTYRDITIICTIKGSVEVDPRPVKVEVVGLELPEENPPA